MRWAFTIGLALCASPFPGPSWADEGLKNPGFEAGAVGEHPPGWTLRNPKYGATIAADGPKEGRRSVVIAPAAGEAEPGVAVLVQMFDAKAYQGKRVTLRASVRIGEPRPAMGQAQLWMRVDRAGGRMGFFDNMADRPVRSTEWSEVEIRGEVAPDGERISVGLIVLGGATARLGDVSMAVSGEAPTVRSEAPRPIEGRGLENLVAFSRLVGYVRHFHPSDQVAAADWDRFAVAGVLAAEPARDPAELAERLGALFAPVAPTLRVFPTGQEPPRTPEALAIAPGGPDAKVASWIHHGLGPKATLGTMIGGLYRSRRDYRPLLRGRPPADGPDPAAAFAADLGGGVSCLVPLAVYADAKGTLPAAPKDAGPAALAGRPSGDDRATRLAVIVLAWNAIQHFYPYFDVVEADWPGALRSALTSAASDRDEVAFVTTLRRLVAAYRDGHGNAIFTGEPPKATLPIAWDWVEGKLVVTVGGKEGDVRGPGAATSSARSTGMPGGRSPRGSRTADLGRDAAMGTSQCPEANRRSGPGLADCPGDRGRGRAGPPRHPPPRGTAPLDLAGAAAEDP